MGQLEELCSSARATRKCFCIMGGSFDDITEAYEQPTMDCDVNTQHKRYPEDQIWRTHGEVQDDLEEYVERYHFRNHSQVQSGGCFLQGIQHE